MTTTARVTVTIDIKSRSSWSDETTIAQVRKQATDGALGMLRQIEDKYDLKIIGDPQVCATTTQQI
jgi:hypothetical protein